MDFLGTVPQPKGLHTTAFDLKAGGSGVVAFEKAEKTVAYEKTNGGAGVKSLIGPDAGPAPSYETSSAATSTTTHRTATGTPDLPPGLAADDSVLTYRGYFREGVPQSTLESWRQRHLVLRFHVRDGTIDITEPGARNDGLPHGRFLKRCALPGVTLAALRIGANVDVLGRAVRVYAADGFARRHAEDVLHAPLGPDETPAPDAFTATAAVTAAAEDPAAWHGVKSSSITRYIEAARGNQTRADERSTAEKTRWLTLDGAPPLRFLLREEPVTDAGVLCTVSVPGVAAPPPRLYWLTYHLATRELEVQLAKPTPVLGARGPATGADRGEAGVPGAQAGAGGAAQFLTLVKRARLPKLPLPGDAARGASPRGPVTAPAAGAGDAGAPAPPGAFVTEDDLAVGEQLNVYGRVMTVCDVDAPTQAWYAAERGVDQRARRVETAVAPHVRAEPPPPPPLLGPAGIGGFNEEDTLNSWKYLIPRKPRVDPATMRSATAGPSSMLRYDAVLVADDAVTASRAFRVTLYLDTHELSVYEPPGRNTGVLGGAFAKRDKHKNPATGAAYTPDDFAVGGTVVIKGHTFRVTGIDEASVAAAERTSGEGRHLLRGDAAAVEAIMLELKRKLGESALSLRKMFRKFDKDSSQNISFPEWQAMLEHYTLPISRADSLALFSAFDDGTGFMSYASFMSAFTSTWHATDPLAEYIRGALAARDSETEEHVAHRIAAAESAAKQQERTRYQDLLVSRVARDLSNSREATRIHETFRRFDVNKDGHISKEEFAFIMGTGGLQYSGDDLIVLQDYFFRAADGTPVDTIEYGKFMGTLAIRSV